MEERVLTLYSRQGCHLCDQMWEQLQELRRQIPIRIVLVDVDSAPELQAHYGTRVPVLVHAEYELSELFLDEARVREYLCDRVNGV